MNLGAISFAGFSYLILAAQIYSGVPPFYRPMNLLGFFLPSRQTGTNEEIVLDLMAVVLPAACAAFAIIFVANWIDRNWLGTVSALPPIIGGLKLRQMLAADTKLPRPLLTKLVIYAPAIGRIANRWPMLAFDIWTIGLTSLVAAPALFSQLG